MMKAFSCRLGNIYVCLYISAMIDFLIQIFNETLVFLDMHDIPQVFMQPFILFKFLSQ